MRNISLSRVFAPALIGSAGSLFGVTLTDDFSGSQPNPNIFNTAITTGGLGTMNVGNGQLQFTAGPAASLIGSDHEGNLTSAGLIGTDANWSVSVKAIFDSYGNLGTFGTAEIASLTLAIENPNDGTDSIEINFATGDPFGTGASRFLRTAHRENDTDVVAPTFVDSLTLVNEALISYVYNSSTKTVTAIYDIGSGPMIFDSFDISTWDVASDSSLLLSLNAGASNIGDSDTIQSGTFEIQAGQASFDDFIMTSPRLVPEPSAMLLVSFSGLSLLRRRRS